MAQQFIFNYMRNTYKQQQRLPPVFDEHFYNGDDMLYITGNDRDRYKVNIEMINGSWVLWDDDWIDFVKSNVPASAREMHFIRQGVNSYYVTAYKEDGSECYGYDRNLIGPRVTRCMAEYDPEMEVLPGDFLQDVWVNMFTIRCDNVVFEVNHRRVQLDLNSRKRDNCLFGPGWEALGNAVGLEPNQRVVFTNRGNNNLSLVMFGGDGLGLCREEIMPILLRRNPRPIQFRDLKDKRLASVCRWPLHVDHVDEDNVFYTPLCAYVTDESRLTIPADFCGPPRYMHTYRKAYVVHRRVRFPMVIEMVVHRNQPFRTNHVIMKGNWRGFGAVCGFEQSKMMRFKMVRIIPEYVQGSQIQVPIFHVC